MLVATRFGETRQLHHVAAPGAARTQLTFGREPISSATAIPGSVWVWITQWASSRAIWTAL